MATDANPTNHKKTTDIVTVTVTVTRSCVVASLTWIHGDKVRHHVPQGCRIHVRDSGQDLFRTHRTPSDHTVR